MSTAPEELKNARLLAISELGIDPLSVGIVGDADHVAGGDSYHLGKDQLSENASYSVRESTRDSRPDNDASALDVGKFSKGGKNLPHLSLWLVAHCKSGTSWTKNIREVIYSPDGKTVKRWDRLGKRSTGDNSHLSHTHISYFRDSNGRGALEMMREYLYEAGIWERVQPAPEEEEFMSTDNFALPADFAFDQTGELIDREAVLVIPAEPAGFGEGAWKGKGLYLSLSTDFATDDDGIATSAKVRVAIHDGSGWTVKTYDVKAGKRISVTVPSAKNTDAYNVSVGRVMTVEGDTFAPPVGILRTIV